MIRFLLWLKSRSSIIWWLIEWFNGVVFGIVFRKRLVNQLNSTLEHNSSGVFSLKMITKSDLNMLESLLKTIEPKHASFFEPHGFSTRNLKVQLKNKGFFMMGVFDHKQLVGYFFLRCGINKKCFLGRYLHPAYRNKGLGNLMNKVLYHSAWNAGFRIFATFSQDNKLVVNAHQKNPYVKHMADLKDNYILVEFVYPGNQK